jgi:hypothetical protein
MFYALQHDRFFQKKAWISKEINFVSKALLDPAKRSLYVIEVIKGRGNLFARYRGTVV